MSTDGLTFRVTLSMGQRWSDGHPITPEDVVATVAFAQSSRAVDHRVTAVLQGVKTSEQGSTLVFTLPAPLASFAATLTQLPILPLGGLSAAQLDALAAKSSQPMPSSGPYRVASADDASILLEANPYATAHPRLSHYQIRLFTSFDDARNAFSHGAVDGLLTTSPSQRDQLLNTTGATAHEISTFRFVDLLFNERQPGLTDPVVRRALSDAVDRIAILQGALAGSGGIMQVDAMSQGLPWISTHNPQERASLAAASAALDAAGWKLGSSGFRARNGTELYFTLTVPNADPLPAVARELAQRIGLIGVGLYVTPVPPQSFVNTALMPHTFQVALADWDGGPDPDVSAFWRSNAVPPQGFNVTGAVTDPFLDRALDSLATLIDPQARITAAGDVSRFLATDAPAVFLYTPMESFVTRVPMLSVDIASTGGGAARYDNVASWRRA